MAKGFWKKLEVLITGYDSEKANREFEAVKAAFDALPKPKDEIPTTLIKVKWK
jgi:hypothetical protein